MIGEENVLYFSETHLEPYQVEKTQNANIVLRTEVLNRLNFDKKKKIIVATASSLSEKVLKKEDFKAISHTIKVGDQLDFDFIVTGKRFPSHDRRGRWSCVRIL